MASEPYTIKNGVKLVDLLVIVRRLQSTEGTSVAHFLTQVLNRVWTSWPSLVRMSGFRPCRIRSFVRGWETAAQSTQMLLSSQKSRNLSPVNCVSLSVMMELGTPKQKTMSWTKLATCLEPILAKGLASIHLVDLSTVTSTWVKPSGTFMRGPKRSRPHTVKDHVIGMVWSSWAGTWIYLAKY
jgi:hypothetical protein